MPKTIKLEAAAQMLGCKPSAAASRLKELGYTKICSRCCGSGRYSYNQMDGDRCWGCDGRKVMLAPLTLQIVTEAIGRIAAGELATYFARNKARKAITAKGKEFMAIYRSSVIAAAYSAIDRRIVDAHVIVQSPEFRAMGLLNGWFHAATEAEHDVVFRNRDALVATARIDAAIAAVAELDAAWCAFEAGRMQRAA